MNGYCAFAAFYDRLTQDIDYTAKAEYLLSLFRLHMGETPTTVLDLACGSGSLAVELWRQGVDVIGVDMSADMLAIAAEKAAAVGCPMLLLEQDMRELDLYGTVEGAVCVLDSLNHLSGTKEVAETLSRLSLFIQPNGLLIFDVNTPYKHAHVLADNAYVFEQEEFMCVWRNRFSPRTCTVEMYLDFFVQEGLQYARYSDVVRERAYTVSTWRRLLAQAGFQILAVYEDMTTETPVPTSQRLVVVAKNKKD